MKLTATMAKLRELRLAALALGIGAAAACSDGGGLTDVSADTTTVDTGTRAGTPTPTTGDYGIAIRWLSAPTDRHRQAIESAVARWQSVIRNDVQNVPVRSSAGDCFDTQPAMNETVDDLVIFVEFVPIDGAGKILGQSGPCYVRTSGGLPIVGRMRLDIDDLRAMETHGTLDDVVLHEMGHILGIGTLWAERSLVQGTGTDNPLFIGAGAVSGYAATGGTGPVPVENSGSEGTRDAHWRESVFGNELMTGYISTGSNPLSAITIGSLRDLGYGADLTAATSFRVAAGTSAVLGEEIGRREQVHGPRKKIDHGGRMTKIR